MSFSSEGRAAGFTEEQIKFLTENFSRPGHHHSIGQVDSLVDALAEANDGQFDEDDVPEDDEDDFEDDEEDDNED